MRSSRVVLSALMAVFIAVGLSSHQRVAAAPVSFSGILTVIHGDPQPGSNLPHQTRYIVYANGASWNVKISDAAISAAGGASALNGKFVDIVGDEVAPGTIVAESISLSAGANAIAAPAEAIVSGSKDYATVLCKFADVAAEPQPVGFFTTLMGMTKPGLNHYWREVSYENINLDGSQEFNWVTMANPRASYFDADGNALLTKLAQECADAATGALDFSSFFGINFVFNDNLDCCAWGGSVDPDEDGAGVKPATWMPPWAWTGRVFGHESGHSLGLDHTSDQYGNEYGNRWDVMGSGLQTHVNAFHKDHEGWIPPAEIYNATGALNQQIRLVNLALPPDDLGEVLSDYMMAKIPIAGSDDYYTLEARKKTGYDGSPGGIPFEGVVIHLVDPTSDSRSLSPGSASEIVDGTNNGNAADDGPAWVPGELFVDEAAGISVAIISEYDDGWVVAINPNTDVTVSKSATPNPAVAGELLTYNITVSNLGPGPATNVVVKDTLPAFTTYDENTLGAGACAGPIAQVLTCTLPGTLAAGATKTFAIVVRVAANIPVTNGTTTITNTVNVVAAQDDDPTATNNNFSLTTLVVTSADLRLAKECKPDEPAPTGSNANCAITVDNLGPSDAANVVVTDTHTSAGAFTISSAIATPGGPCGIAGGVVTCNLGTEPAGGRTTIVVTLSSLAAGDVNDTACVASSTPDPNDANNCDTDGVNFFSRSDLALVKSGSPNPVVAGQNITHTINVTNLGPSIATGVVVKDNLPAEVTMVSATPSIGTCIPGTPGNPALPLTCNLGNIANGGIATITVVSTVKSNTANGTILSNGASVSSSSLDPDNSNNSQSVLTNVVTRADLAIVKTADAATYKPNTTITYRVTVTNNGASDAQSVGILDTLPEMKQAVYLSDTGGCIFQAPKSLTCSLGTMPSGTSKEFFIMLKVKGAQGTITNAVTVNSTTTDPVAGNNTSSVDVIIKGGK